MKIQFQEEKGTKNFPTGKQELTYIYFKCMMGINDYII